MINLKTAPCHTVTIETKSSEVPQEKLAIQMFASELEQIQAITQPDLQEIAMRGVYLGEKTHKHTLVLDLNETLILCHGFHADSNGMVMQLQLRPYAKYLLKKLSALFELVIYTAAEEDFASAALMLLDPELKYVKKLLARPHCIRLQNGLYVKDLRIFCDRSIQEILIADNCIFSFAFQLANGIPVNAFSGHPADRELLFLLKYLQELSHESDIVRANQARIGLC